MSNRFTNDTILKGKWNQLKDRVGEKWNKFTQDDLGEINGNVEKLYDKLQEKYGYTKEEAKKAFDEAAKKWHNLVD